MTLCSDTEPHFPRGSIHVPHCLPLCLYSLYSYSPYRSVCVCVCTLTSQELLSLCILKEGESYLSLVRPGRQSSVLRAFVIMKRSSSPWTLPAAWHRDKQQCSGINGVCTPSESQFSPSGDVYIKHPLLGRLGSEDTAPVWPLDESPGWQKIVSH